MSTSTTANITRAPTIDALPQTPADEWAERTNSMLGAQEGDTPGRDMPGAFPQEPAREPAAAPAAPTRSGMPRPDDGQGGRKAYLRACASTLPPAQLTFHAAAQADAVDLDLDLAPPRPPFAAHSANRDSVNSNLSTEAQAGSIGPPRLDSESTLSAADTLDSVADSNLSTRVHTGGPASPHPVAPLPTPAPGSRFAEALVTPPLPPHSQSAGPDVAPPPAPHGVLEPPPRDTSTPTEEGADGTPSADATGQRKPNLVQRLKEKMHVGHAQA
ncbi:hypothetical protein FB451DRAFT_1179936 [Mycena latifolia]|nr:hypothetical protein FB451DRAFT_1179936 [Mycena latifolia]